MAARGEGEHVERGQREARDDQLLAAHAIGEAAAEIVGDGGRRRAEEKEQADPARRPVESLDGVHTDVDPERRERGAVRERDCNDRQDGPLDLAAKRGAEEPPGER